MVTGLIDSSSMLKREPGYLEVTFLARHHQRRDIAQAIKHGLVDISPMPKKLSYYLQATAHGLLFISLNTSAVTHTMRWRRYDAREVRAELSPAQSSARASVVLQIGRRYNWIATLE